MDKNQTIRIDKHSFDKVEKKEARAETRYERSVFRDVLRSLRENKLAIVCCVILAIIIIASLLAPLCPYDPDEQDVLSKLQPPSTKHWFGMDELGRDYFTRALYGGRISLTVGFLSMIMSVVIGTVIGTVSGYMGGKVDAFLMRFTDIFMSVPSFLLMVVINALFPPKVYSMVIILGLFEWCQIARITRAETLSLKERDFVLAAKHLGASNVRIMFRHIVPNMSSSIIVAGSLAVARAILTESTLSFMGLGVQLPKASWGTMLQVAQVYIMDTPWLAVFPGIFIVATVMSFNILGDALRNALEPKHAAEKLGYRKVPVIIRVLSEDDSILSMVDSNLHRERISYSEKAFAYKLKNDVLKRKSGRKKSQVDHKTPRKRAIEIISEDCGDSPKQVQRYISLTKLIPEMLQKLDDEIISFCPAVEIAALSEKEQKELLVAMEYAQAIPSLSQAQRIRQMSKEKQLSLEKMEEIMCEVKKGEITRVAFTNEQLHKYFPNSYTPAMMKREILALLKLWKKESWES